MAKAKKSKMPVIFGPDPIMLPAPQETAKDKKSFEDLQKYMSETYKVRIGDSCKGIPMSELQTFAQGIEDVAKEFPKALEALTNGKFGYNITVSTYMSPSSLAHAYAACGADGSIKINPTSKFWGTAGNAAKSYQNDLKSGYHPKGTTVQQVSSHEAGHALEAALIKQGLANGTISAWEASTMWNKCTLAKDIIGQATKAIPKGAMYNGKDVSKLKGSALRKSLSGYADSKMSSGGIAHSETLAECVADYVANRDNAHPLSQQVWKILKDKLG